MAAVAGDHEDTRALRALCRARKDLVETRVQITNPKIMVTNGALDRRPVCLTGR